MLGLLSKGRVLAGYGSFPFLLGYCLSRHRNVYNQLYLYIKRIDGKSLLSLLESGRRALPQHQEELRTAPSRSNRPVLNKSMY